MASIQPGVGIGTAVPELPVIRDIHDLTPGMTERMTRIAFRGPSVPGPRRRARSRGCVGLRLRYVHTRPPPSRREFFQAHLGSLHLKTACKRQLRLMIRCPFRMRSIG